MLPDKFLKSFDGIKIAYRFDKRDISKPVLFFVHGFFGNSSAWDKVVEIVQKQGYSTLVMDLRGHGLSEKPGNKKFYSINNLVKDVGLIVEKENIDYPVFIGHSFGGSVLLKYLLNSDSKVGKLVLCNTPHTVPFYYCPSWFVRKFYPVFRPFLRLVAKLNFGRKKNYEYPVYSDFVGLSEWQLAKKDLSSGPLRVYCWNFLLFYDYKIDLNLLGEKDVPTLLITSNNDGMVSPASVEELSKIMKRSKFVKIAGCDHETIFRKPDEVAGLILEFLR